MKSTWKNAPFYICVKSSVIAYRKKTRFSHLPASAGTRVCLRVRSFALTLHKCETHTEWERRERERESEQKHCIHRENEKHQQWVRAHFVCTLSHSNELLAFKINICFFRFIFPFLIHFFLSVCMHIRMVCVCFFMFISLRSPEPRYYYGRLWQWNFVSLDSFTCDMWNSQKYMHVSIPFHFDVYICHT